LVTWELLYGPVATTYAILVIIACVAVFLYWIVTRP
jgi:type IV secretory pathway VirB2 component (pilin)